MADINLRTARARRMALLLMRELKEILPLGMQTRVHHRLIKALALNGFAVTCDEERDRLGLEPRDVRGWTSTEKLIKNDEKIIDFYSQ